MDRDEIIRCLTWQSSKTCDSCTIGKGMDYIACAKKIHESAAEDVRKMKGIEQVINSVINSTVSAVDGFTEIMDIVKGD